MTGQASNSTLCYCDWDCECCAMDCPLVSLTIAVSICCRATSFLTLVGPSAAVVVFSLLMRVPSEEVPQDPEGLGLQSLHRHFLCPDPQPLNPTHYLNGFLKLALRVPPWGFSARAGTSELYGRNILLTNTTHPGTPQGDPRLHSQSR